MYGRRGQLCQNFNWTWEYLHNGISFNTLQKILLDLPDYNSEDDDEEVDDEEVELQEMTAEEMNQKLSNLF